MITLIEPQNIHSKQSIIRMCSKISYWTIECKLNHFPTLKTVSLTISEEKVREFNQNNYYMDCDNWFDCFEAIDKIVSII